MAHMKPIPVSAQKSAHQGAFKVHGAFQAAARPLYAGAVCRQARGSPLSVRVITLADLKASSPGLAELAEGPYFVLALMLDVNSLCCADATCRLLRQLNRANIGPWRALGIRAFHGMELEREGTFEKPDGPELHPCSGRKLARVDWKGRFNQFRTDVPTFCTPFGGREITAVAHPDEVAYFRCRLCTDVLAEEYEQGVYLEVEVVGNPDNLSMAVVDFEAGGCSSVTFSPDTGAVIRERKVREAPRKVEGAYIQPLPTVPPGRPFHGLMGLYLHRGRLAFFRRCELPPEEGSSLADLLAFGAQTGPVPTDRLSMAGLLPPGGAVGSAAQTAQDVAPRRPVMRFRDVRAVGRPGEGRRPNLGAWECTGFISDLAWAEGRRLTPCLAFRDEGAYRVRVVTVGSKPPMAVPIKESMGAEAAPSTTSRDAESDWRSGWSGFDWEVGAPENGPNAPPVTA
eukprot:CAMPEP_0197688586 /NCGR_PEP_ID=MMETSP1338-20131121/105655_1 /TAXON_ID=43686 ORGANISM="Pelagodinium beii, Strain RCC1491" /NCGR_SAMPLE_ID=MMETSP1338 /ASSEMBLY_ACC=CAM_ASM_000754 /LENGTH=454 /DNA_ID=CAMNT_0043270807 /DNA_START=23 /DNA_END=1387 /DNA_ORIENTATION=-